MLGVQYFTGEIYIMDKDKDERRVFVFCCAQCVPFLILIQCMPAWWPGRGGVCVTGRCVRSTRCVLSEVCVCVCVFNEVCVQGSVMLKAPLGETQLTCDRICL
ncbi:unnamed protein product [Arctogadus glacialis]